MDPLFASPEPARAEGALVAFGTGARTARHTHPLGRTGLCLRTVTEARDRR